MYTFDCCSYIIIVIINISHLFQDGFITLHSRLSILKETDRKSDTHKKST